MYCILPSRKRELNIYSFKKKETVFYNITYKPAVTHILETLLEYEFHDVTFLIIEDFIKLFC